MAIAPEPPDLYRTAHSVLIAGVAGSGKTAVITAFHRRGLVALELTQGLCYWRDIKTGLRVDPRVDVTSEGDHQARFEWVADTIAVGTMLGNGFPPPVFVSGTVANLTDIWSLFDCHVYLSVNDPELRRRLEFDSAAGKAHSDAGAVEWNSRLCEFYRRLGAYEIDANQPVELVAESIMKVAGLDV